MLTANTVSISLTPKPPAPGADGRTAMPQPTRPTWTNSHHWPTCHKSQADAGLPDGPLTEQPAPITRWQHLCFGVVVGLLIVGPAIADLWGAL